MTEEEEFNLDDVIIIADQESVIASLIKNLTIIRAEVRQCILIENEFTINLQNFKVISSNLAIKLQALSNLAARFDAEKKNKVDEFVKKIYRSWNRMSLKFSEEHAIFFVASRTVYGLALTTLLSEIKNEVAGVNFSLQIGEAVYDQEYLIKGYMYYNELIKLMSSLEGCDEKVQQYLTVKKITKYLQDLDILIDQFARQMNLLNAEKRDCDVFSYVSKLLTGEMFGWYPADPEVILKENAPRKPVFITKNNRRTQVKSLQHLPLFH